ncbi:MAG: hypothetical protein JNM66_18200 [Bryobacterales bacterium]|nr:hypothetical protein [Bryobacterales bacterium]
MSVELDHSILQAALEGFESQLAKLNAQIAYVRSQVPGTKKAADAHTGVDVAPKVRGRRKGRSVSEEGRKRMAEAQKRRWAKARGEA